ncbi:MAG: membrane dipeptidase, partial [Acidobacteriota bacterium]
NVVQATMPLLPVPNLSDLFPVTGFDDLNDFHAALASQGGASGVECVHRDTFQPMDCSTCLRDREPCRNVVGLTPLGEELVRAMVDRRLLIDIAHLSEVGVLDVWRVVQDQSPTDTYPLYVSHGDARDALADNGGNKGQHQEKPTPQWVFDIIRQSGGMFGLRTGPDQFATQATSLVDNDCAGSSKSFAQSLEHALQTADVETGFAVDMNGMIANSAPRFVDNQSWKMRRRGERAACLGSDWQQSLQNRGVVDDPTTPFTDESRFNHHGLGHIGMLGALIDDLENSGLPVDVIGAIFSSAEAFVEMWENVP